MKLKNEDLTMEQLLEILKQMHPDVNFEAADDEDLPF